jgi:glycosyltransferase involved in cell wall biosynthesis
MTISAVGVVIPARDEEILLPASLEALGTAVDQLDGLSVHVVVVLDRCRDRTAAIVAAHPWVSAVTIDAGNVGAARRAGAKEVLRWAADTPFDQLWLANTDADSTVPADWLTGQVALASDGWDAVVGTVAVADWSEHHPSVSAGWAADYVTAEHHPHVHGANLGLTAAAYVDVGGWPRLPAHEDVELLRNLRSHRVVATAMLPVVTSARRSSRVTGGFGDAVKSIAG